MKTMAAYFTDWEQSVFGYGYGLGEAHILPALKQFLAQCVHGERQHAYQYQDLEQTLSPRVTWLLINVLCHADILAYGSSPRFGWLTAAGERLRDFLLSQPDEALVALTRPDDTVVYCYPDRCQCGPESICQNPFWGTP